MKKKIIIIACLLIAGSIPLIIHAGSGCMDTLFGC